MKRNFIIIL